jgi:hypothetical protein
VLTNVDLAIRALGDPTRRTIFELIADTPMSVGAIAEEMPVSRPAVSQHLKVLVYDRLKDGGESHWSRVLVYEPPNRIVFSWDISPQWQIESDPDKTSEVEVRFTSEGPSTTRVELEHRHLDHHGDGWQDMRGAVGSEGGWPLGLTRFSDRLAVRRDAGETTPRPPSEPLAPGP